MRFKDFVQDQFKEYESTDKPKYAEKCPEIVKEIKDLKNPDYVNITPYHYNFTDIPRENRYPNPYPLINCDSSCKKKLDYKVSIINKNNPFIKKNESIVEESIISTNKTYMFLYIWLIVMIIVIYVLIITVVSKNSYHPLMNVIIFIFLVYMSYYLIRNLSF